MFIHIQFLMVIYIKFLMHLCMPERIKLSVFCWVSFFSALLFIDFHHFHQFNHLMWQYNWFNLCDALLYQWLISFIRQVNLCNTLLTVNNIVKILWLFAVVVTKIWVCFWLCNCDFRSFVVPVWLSLRLIFFLNEFIHSTFHWQTQSERSRENVGMEER